MHDRVYLRDGNEATITDFFDNSYELLDGGGVGKSVYDKRKPVQSPLVTVGLDKVGSITTGGPRSLFHRLVGAHRSKDEPDDIIPILKVQRVQDGLLRDQKLSRWVLETRYHDDNRRMMCERWAEDARRQGQLVQMMLMACKKANDGHSKDLEKTLQFFILKIFFL